MNQKEIWRDVKDFEGLYQVSNFGRVKSLLFKKEKVLKPHASKGHYYCVSLHKNKLSKTFKVHKLVAIAFINHEPNGYKTVVDHIDNNPLNNNVDNLQLISHRENCSKDKKGTSKYTGVCFIESTKKWKSYININGNSKTLGYFNSEIEASNAYKQKIKQL